VFVQWHCFKIFSHCQFKKKHSCIKKEKLKHKKAKSTKLVLAKTFAKICNILMLLNGVEEKKIIGAQFF